MTTPTTTLASLLASAVWADGDYSEVEREAVAEIADALDVNLKELEMNMTAALVEMKHLDEKAATEYAVKHAGKVADEDTGPVFQALMQLVLADGVLTQGEAHNLITLGEALDIEPSMTVLMLCDMVKTEPELEVSFDEDEED